MNRDIIKGNCSPLTGEIKSEWGKLTDDEIEQAAVERERFLGLIQEKYGMAKAEAEADRFCAIAKSAS